MHRLSIITGHLIPKETDSLRSKTLSETQTFAPGPKQFKPQPPKFLPHLQAWNFSQFKDITANVDETVAITRAFARFAGADDPHIATLRNGFDKWLVSQEEPTHSKILLPLLHHFTLQALSNYVPVIEKLVDELLKEAETKHKEQGEVDIISTVTSVLPVRVIMYLLGVDNKDIPNEMSEWCELISVWLNNRPLDNLDELKALAKKTSPAMDGLINWAAKMYDKGSSSFRDGSIINHLLQKAESGKLPKEEVIINISFLFFAGSETTVNFLGSSLWFLATNPSVRDDLIAHPELIDSFIEEALRFLSPVQIITRAFNKDKTLNHFQPPIQVKRGQRAIFALAAGNKDPQVFERPNEFILRRFENHKPKVLTRADGEKTIVAPPPVLVSFGSGMHRCLGQYLTRTEARVFFLEFLRRYPKFHLSTKTASPHQWKALHSMLGAQHLHLVLHE